MSHPEAMQFGARNPSGGKHPETDETCHRTACAIQTCLERNQWKEARCRDAIDAYQACIKRMQAKQEAQQKGATNKPKA